MTGVEKLLAAEANSPSAVAKRLSELGQKCTRQVVQHWMGAGHVPGKWAPLVNRLYDIPLHELNPEIYPESMTN